MRTTTIRIGFLAMAAALTACGGGEIDENPAPQDDIFDAVAAESAAFAGLRFAHQYAVRESDEFGDDESTSFDCPDYAALDEVTLRSSATSSNEHRVCFQSSGNQVCEYPGERALRESTDGPDFVAEAVALRTADDGDSAIFLIRTADSGQPQFDLVGLGATERNPACNDGADPGFAAADIEDTWSARAYAIDAHGVPALALAGTFTCSGASCTSSSGISMANLAESAVSGDGLVYQSQVTIAGASYAVSRTVLSQNKRTLATLACPSGTAITDMLLACRYLIAERQ